MVALELEVMAKKMDRFGWDRDRGSMAHDRLVTDWMDALQDYQLEEVKAACVAWVREQPRKMPNEGDILALINRARAKIVQALPKQGQGQQDGRVSPEKAAQILAEVGFRPRKFGN